MADDPNAIDLLVRFANSSFISSVVGALAGAFFGALAATRFAENQEVQRLLLDEMRKNNSGVVIASSIANHCLTFKKQLVRELVEKFENDKRRYQAHLEAAAGGRAPGLFELQFDFRSLTHFKHEAEELRSLLVTQISAEPKTTMAALQLWQSLHSLEKVVAQREGEISRLSSLVGKISDDDLAQTYFGLPTRTGRVDERYSDTIVAMKDLLDSAIFFSTFVAEQLSRRGEGLAKKLGKKSPNPIKWSFSSINEADLLPDPNEFSDWV
jgi:hypothetical protein